MTREFTFEINDHEFVVEYDMEGGQLEIGVVRQLEDGQQINVNLMENTNLRYKLELAAWENWQADLASMAESRAADEYEWWKFERGES